MHVQRKTQMMCQQTGLRKQVIQTLGDLLIDFFFELSHNRLDIESSWPHGLTHMGHKCSHELRITHMSTKCHMTRNLNESTCFENITNGTSS